MNNINWIECNLPYQQDELELADLEFDFQNTNYPKMDDSLHDKLLKKQAWYKKYRKARDKYWADTSPEIGTKEFQKSADEYDKYNKIYNSWVDNELCPLPEYKKLEEEYLKKIEQYKKDLEEHLSKYQIETFCSKGLKKPGVLVETDKGEYFLFGNINLVAGVCDGNDFVGPAIGVKTIIKRYAVVFDADANGITMWEDK